MQMLYCPSCKRPTGFKRSIGVGTLLLSCVTVGFWLLAIPFYTVRCCVCGTPKGDTPSATLKVSGLKRNIVIFTVMVVVLAGLLLLARFQGRLPGRRGGRGDGWVVALASDQAEGPKGQNAEAKTRTGLQEPARPQAAQ